MVSLPAQYGDNIGLQSAKICRTKKHGWKMENATVKNKQTNANTHTHTPNFHMFLPAKYLEARGLKVVTYEAWISLMLVKMHHI